MALEKKRERRNFGRRDVFKPATIVLSSEQRLKATVLDLSSGGARIKVGRPENVTGEFILEIPNDDFVVKCQVRWVEKNEIGAEFVKSPRRLSWIGRVSRRA